MHRALLPALVLFTGCRTYEAGNPGTRPTEPAQERVTEDTGTSVDPFTDIDQTAARDDASTWVMAEVGTEIAASAEIQADGSLVGELQFTRTQDDETICEKDYSLAGGAYTGDCAGCDYAFAIESTLVSETGDSSQCWTSTAQTFEISEDGWGVDPFIAFWSSYTTESWSWTDYYTGYTYTYGGYSYTDLARVGYSVYWPGYEPYYMEPYTYEGPYGSYYFPGYYFPGSDPFTGGPYFWTLAHSGSGDAAFFERTGDLLEWGSSYSYATYVSNDAWNWCDTGMATYAAANRLIGDSPSTGSLPCDAMSHDSFVFEASAGDEIWISVDTVSEETAFDPNLWVNGPDSCTIAWADDEMDCSYPPPGFGCPSVKLVVEETGQHELFVSTNGYCAGETGGYVLDVHSR